VDHALSGFIAGEVRDQDVPGTLDARREMGTHRPQSVEFVLGDFGHLHYTVCILLAN
jgi:hypothetical protein